MINQIVIPAANDLTGMALFLMARPEFAPVLDDEGRCVGVQMGPQTVTSVLETLQREGPSE